MKKIRKKLNGLTLVEVIIALAVFTIMSSFLAGSIAMVCNIFRNTVRLTDRISNEAPNAEIKRGGVKVTEASTEPTMVMEIDGNSYSFECDKYIVTDDPSNDYDGADFKYFVIK